MTNLKILNLLLLSSCFSLSACSAAPNEATRPTKKVDLVGENCEVLLEAGEKFISEYYMVAPKDFEGVRKYTYEMLDSFCKDGIGVFIMKLYLEIPIPKEYRKELKEKTNKEFMYGIFLIELRAVPDYENNEIILDYGSIQPFELGVIE